MPPELPPDDNDDGSDQELLDKVDALLKRHQPRRYTAPTAPPVYAPPPEYTAPPEYLPPAAITEPPAFDSAAFDDIPVLTDVVDKTTDSPTPSDALSHDLEERLCRELEQRITPQLSQLFDRTLHDLLEQAKIHIGQTVRQYLAQELDKQRDKQRHS